METQLDEINKYILAAQRARSSGEQFNKYAESNEAAIQKNSVALNFVQNIQEEIEARTASDEYSRFDSAKLSEIVKLERNIATLSNNITNEMSASKQRENKREARTNKGKDSAKESK